MFDDLNRVEAFNFLKIYIDFAFYLGICPFRLELVNQQLGLQGTVTRKRYTTRSYLPQKLICASSSFLGFLWFLSTFRTTLFPNVKRSSRIHSTKYLIQASYYVGVVGGFISLLLKSTAVLKFWAAGGKLVSILNFILDGDCNTGNKNVNIYSSTDDSLTCSRISKKVGVTLICLAYTIGGISNWIMGYGLGHISDWSWKWWWEGVVKSSHFNFFLGNATFPSQRHLELPIGILGVIGFFNRQLISYFLDLFLLMNILTLWSLSRAFSAMLVQNCVHLRGTKMKWGRIFLARDLIWKLQMEPGQLSRNNKVIDWQKIDVYFKSLRNLAGLINNLVGTHLTLFLADNVLYYSTTFHQVFILEWENVDKTKVLRLLFFMCNIAFVFVSSADICKQMESVQRWLQELVEKEELSHNGNRIPLEKLSSLLTQVKAKSVSIKASNVFPFTFSMLGEVSNKK